jgi:hypothetical protein
VTHFIHFDSERCLGLAIDIALALVRDSEHKSASEHTDDERLAQQRNRN